MVQLTGPNKSPSDQGDHCVLEIPFLKWRHFKEAFSPHIVYDAIQNHGGPIQHCIDPFGGSGTTAVTCQLVGVTPTTIEVNPYLADLIEAKLCVYDIDKLVRDLTKLLQLADKVDSTKRISALPPTFVEPGKRDRWIFDRDVAERILALALAIDLLDSDSHKRLFRVLLGGILVPLSNILINGKGRRYRKRWQQHRNHPADVDRLFTEAAITAIQEIRRFSRRPTCKYNVIRADSRKALAGLGPFELAVFSPPYPNSFDYTDVYNIELWMLGYISTSDQNRILRQSTLSSHVQIQREYLRPPIGSERLDDTIDKLNSRKDKLWNAHIPAMIGSYFRETIDLVCSLRNELSPGGQIWLVAGDSSYAGVGIGVAQIIAELAESEGFTVVKLIELKRMRKSAQQGGQIQLAENLIGLSTD